MKNDLLLRTIPGELKLELCDRNNLDDVLVIFDIAALEVEYMRDDFDEGFRHTIQMIRNCFFKRDRERLYDELWSPEPYFIVFWKSSDSVHKKVFSAYSNFEYSSDIYTYYNIYSGDRKIDITYYDDDFVEKMTVISIQEKMLRMNS